MPDPQNKLREWEYSESPLETILSAPFVAAAQANEAMSREQIRFVVDFCFCKVGDVYEPVMIPMMITRGYIKPGKDPQLEKQELEILVPLITLLSISPLVVDDVDVHYRLDITSHQSTDEISDQLHNCENSSTTESKNVATRLHAQVRSEARTRKLRTRGRVGDASTGDLQNSVDTEVGLAIRMKARASELPLGLTMLLQAYANSIVPEELHHKD